MKQKINVFEYAQEIVGALPKSALLTTKSGGKINSMTIAWGALGVEWGESVFIAFVREGRFTRELLDESREFTVNIPYGAFDKGNTAQKTACRKCCQVIKYSHG